MSEGDEQRTQHGDFATPVQIIAESGELRFLFGLTAGMLLAMGWSSWVQWMPWTIPESYETAVGLVIIVVTPLYLAATTGGDDDA